METQVPIPPEHIENSDPMRKQLQWIETIEKRLAEEKARSLFDFSRSIYIYHLNKGSGCSMELTINLPAPPGHGDHAESTSDFLMELHFYI